MKKYWKSITAFAVAVLGIGLYYTFSSFAFEDAPDFSIKTVEGDDQIVSDLIIDGHIRSGNTFDQVWISSSGTKYRSNQSFFNSIEGPEYTTSRSLQKKYKSFMRGKSYFATNMYEDEGHLLHVSNSIRGTNNGNELELSKLDKSTSSATENNIKLVNTTEYYDVQDVQIVDEKVVVVTRNWIREDNSGSYQIHTYTFDLDSLELIDDNIIIKKEEMGENDYEARISMLSNSKPLSQKDHAIFRKTVNKINHTTQGNYSEEEISNDLLAYEYSTGETKIIELPEKLNGLSVEFFDGEALYFISHDDERKLIVYNLGQEKVVNEIHLNDVLGKNGLVSTSLSLKDGQLYLLDYMKNKPTITIMNMDSEDIIYEGVILASNDKNQEMLEIEGMRFKY
ncbi:hypothetical protein CEY16_06250 [Halalkalibacillus sediminis]|uniref:DUF5050 domain-containing protein n=1 Tax=Halalkalibacillus sediminis TaxID=2018042 RepID=A0A2I0QYY4_9BACI|nr:hypothetical protein [Halalkalibacillus sediminis]PKR79340.1 hypothetical protein CEY16_06250 [Halalkalibacillus sediminis]